MNGPRNSEGIVSSGILRVYMGSGIRRHNRRPCLAVQMTMVILAARGEGRSGCPPRPPPSQIPASMVRQAKFVADLITCGDNVHSYTFSAPRVQRSREHMKRGKGLGQLHGLVTAATDACKHFLRIGGSSRNWWYLLVQCSYKSAI